MTGTPEMLCDGLGWPEGPSVLEDGLIVFVDSYASQVSAWTPERGVYRYAYTAGAPNSCVVGADDVLYVCQNGGTVGAWRAPEMTVPSIQRIEAEGAAPEIILTEVEGVKLRGPNDLVFSPDGTLFFTDPGTYNPAAPDPSFIFALRPDGRAEVVVEFERPVFPNGLAASADGAVVWDESYTGQLGRTRGVRGAIEVICRLPGDGPIPDGMKIGADGRMYVCDLSHGGIHIVSPDGVAEGFLAVGEAPTNCLFVGAYLIVTDAGRLADSAAASSAGRLWRVPLETCGTPLVRGSIERSTT